MQQYKNDIKNMKHTAFYTEMQSELAMVQILEHFQWIISELSGLMNLIGQEDEREYQSYIYCYGNERQKLL